MKKEEKQNAPQRENADQSGKRALRSYILIGAFALLLILAAFIVRFYMRVAVDPQSLFSTPTPRLILSPAPTLLQETAAEMEEKSTPAPSPTPNLEEELRAQAAKDFMEGRVNILLLGYDQSPEREDEDSALYRDEKNNFRSDVMMLLSVDFANNKIDLISIPRDTMASIYETKGRWKINAAFAKGGSVEGDGFYYAIKTVENLLQVPIAHYAGVNMEGVKAVVDAMGGVDYTVDVRIVLNGRVLEEGDQHLDGQQVLDYCRARKRITGSASAGANSDVGRADRQQRILFAIFEQLQQKGQLAKIPKIYNSVKNYIYTDLNIEQIAALALFGEKLDVQTQLHRYTLPGEMVTKTSFSNATFYVLDTPKTQDMIEQIFGIRIKMDHRFSLSYVLCEKQAKRGRDYVAATEYICGLLGIDLARYAPPRDEMNAYYDPVYLALYTCMENTQTLCERTPWSEVDGYDDALVTRSEEELSALTEATDALAQSLQALCQSRSLTQRQVEKELLPEELYTLLPK